MAAGVTTGIQKSFKCTAATAAFIIVKFGADDDTIAAGTASTEELIGISQHATTVAGEEIRIAMSGISELKLGGTVTRGARITSDASGQGVEIGAVAGTNYNSIGMALASGVAGDIIPVLICQSRPQG